MSSLLMFCLLTWFGPASIMVNAMDVQVFNASDCAANSLNTRWTFNWINLGPTAANLTATCAMNAAAITPVSSAATTQSVWYRCARLPSSGKYSFSAMTFNSSAADCLDRAAEMDFYTASSGDPGVCQGVSIMDSRSQQYNLFLKFNCSADGPDPPTPAAPGNSASATASAVSLMMVLSFVVFLLV